ncbi:cold-shock protein [candidate division LCP-89 bacterium B3_LCP]|uniref:Cold-shock protein n=1 Tax=candidate division LCP-89 bacterium B3_LCP TaxID=2012998 RepID=A0A532V4K5_UNCL8|nr:MAG: cold-shock protein [candidate division LCP-89 bacterium B3_LCP]
MSQGTVKWFNPRKGFGFITVDDTDGDVFVHANEVTGAGFRNELLENQRVEFEVGQGPKGPMATGVKVIE